MVPGDCRSQAFPREVDNVWNYLFKYGCFNYQNFTKYSRTHPDKQIDTKKQLEKLSRYP